jgi:hypothetical protein
MNSRLIAFALMLVVGLQSLLSLPAEAAQPADVASHCDESGMHGDSAKHEAPKVQHECPHCDGAGANHDCNSYCAVAVGLAPATWVFSSEHCSERVTAQPPALLSRFDIPPTPPPIV